MSFYERHIFSCQNEREPGHPRGCCGGEKGVAIATRFKQMMRKHGVSGVRSNKAMCLDRCEHGPVIVIYPEGTWYRIEDVDVDVEEIVVSHLIGGEVVERLQLPAREHDPFAK